MKITAKAYQLFLFSLLAGFSAWAQEFPELVALKSNERIQIDGEANEEIWSKLQPAQNFYQYFPSDTSIAISI